MAAVCVPERLMHREQLSIEAQPSTALRFKERTRSKGGDAGEEALWRAWSDWRHAVKHVHEPPEPEPEEDLCLGVDLRWGVAVGLGK